MRHSSSNSVDHGFQCAAIFSKYGATADNVVDLVVAQLRREGKFVVGLRQCTCIPTCSDNTSRIQNIETGLTYRLSQTLNSTSSFEFNSDALEQTSTALLARLDDAPDLIVFNRFGQQESDGRGFCQVMEKAAKLKIPVLTVVNSRWQQIWHDYAPGRMTTLPSNYECVMRWCQAIIFKPEHPIREKSGLQNVRFAQR